MTSGALSSQAICFLVGAYTLVAGTSSRHVDSCPIRTLAKVPDLCKISLRSVEAYA